MPFSTETEQIKKFENDEVAQHYFEVLRTLISKKSIFAQQIGLQEVANYLGEIFTAAAILLHLFWRSFFLQILLLRPLFSTTTTIQCRQMMTSLGPMILLRYLFIMGSCMGEEWMMTRGTLPLV